LKGKDWKLTVFGEQARPGSGQPGDAQGSSGQWNAGAGVRKQWTLDSARLDTHQASQLKGGNVALEAGQALAIVGSSVQAEQNVLLDADDTRILDTEAQRRFRNQETGRT
ncbi:hemagglutinin repeat-containing protein, partial [Pseudomonas viridiflava]|uniref:hemagglutinin repeat-containing protein n=1 Tax=Pseudomonas viridiflava TaxID=33069 RepID=UPI0013CE72CF